MKTCMSVKTWNKDMTDKDTADLAYWERNMIALYFAEGWYADHENNFPGWLRVLSLEGGKITFHIPDEFMVGNLPEIKPNWDGHTTDMKWMRVLAKHEVGGVKLVDTPK